jgi:hypothetical protein
VRLDDFRLPDFLSQQLEESGGKVEIESGLWLLFVIEARDQDANSLARDLLADVTFAHDSGTSADDLWTLYYVDSANRPAAVHWLKDMKARATGDIRPVAPDHQALIRQLSTSALPHRVAQQLGELHGRGELSAGSINDPVLIRWLLDRWHMPDPIALPTFLTLVSHHLLDLAVLLDQLESDDVDVLNDILKSDVSRDPIDRSRYDAAGEIRRVLNRFQVINGMDQEKNVTTTNPYAAYVDIACVGDRVVMPVDGTMVRVLREHLLRAIRTTRKQLFRGEDFGDFNTLAPWVTDSVALPFRFIKQRLEVHRDLAPMDWLYSIERAIAEVPKQ